MTKIVKTTPDVEKAVGRKIKAYLKWDLHYKTWKCEDFMPAVGAAQKIVDDTNKKLEADFAKKEKEILG